RIFHHARLRTPNAPSARGRVSRGLPGRGEDRGLVFHDTRRSAVTNLAWRTSLTWSPARSRGTAPEAFMFVTASPRRAPSGRRSRQPAASSTQGGAPRLTMPGAWTERGHNGGEQTTLVLQLDPAKARQYKRFLALAGVAQLARACACQADCSPPVPVGGPS